MPTPDAKLITVHHGSLERYEAFVSEHVAARHIDVWLPPRYRTERLRRFPVLYKHDGQNLFDPALSFSGVDWGVHETWAGLSAGREVEEAIVVGIWNTPDRIPEYMPQRAVEEAPNREAILQRFEQRFRHVPRSDAYLRFIVEELKPFIDGRYRTKADFPHTRMMGSSMGGLISLYAFCEYPEVFSGAGCLSPSWPMAGRSFMSYLKRRLPPPGYGDETRKAYFDYGMEARLASYESYQREVDRLFESLGYVRGQNVMTRKFPGAMHSEQAWRDRLHIPIRFFFRTDRAFDEAHPPLADAA